MDYIELRKRTVIKKYHDSDIFNLKKDQKLNKSTNPSKNRTTQGSLEKTKDDIFNTTDNGKKGRIKPRGKKIYIQNYLNTDLFNSELNDSNKKTKSKNRIYINSSSCFDGVLNNEEYSKDLKYYTKTHRSKKKDYDVDKYFTNISAVGRYYKELYGEEKNLIFPKSKNTLSKTLTNSPNKIGINNTVFKNQLKEYELRKKNLKAPKKQNIDEIIFGPKKLNKTIDQGKNVTYNKKRVHILGKNFDEKNNRNIIKEKDGIKYSSKLHKQLQNQSNIFGVENNDIKTKMFNYLKNKKEEKENKLKLKQKIKREREEINSKIKEQNKKNLCLNNNLWGGTHCKWQKSNMDWKDPGAQLLFKKTYTMNNFNTNKDKMTAFQRKLKDLADSDNLDTLSEGKKVLNIEKFRIKRSINVDDNNVDQTKEILRTMPNDTLRIDQKLKIINDSTTSNFLNNTTNENLSKMCNRVNSNIKSARLSKSKKKNSNLIKIMGKNSNTSNKNYINNLNNNNKLKDDYALIYSTKSSNTLDKLNNIDIKKIFGAKGIHIFDIRKNEFVIGDINKIKFKIRESEDDNIKDLEQKIKLVEIDLNKNKYKVNIKKEENIRKKALKNNKEKALKDVNNKNNFIHQKKRNLISQFPIVDLKYKKFSKA